MQILVRETLGVVIALEIDKHFQNHRKGWSFEKRGLQKPIGFTPYSFRVIPGVAEIRDLVRDFFYAIAQSFMDAQRFTKYNSV